MDLFKFARKRSLTGMAHADRRFLWGSDAERFHDRKLGQIAEMADALNARMYTGGWAQCINFNQTGPGIAKNTYTTIADLLPQAPCIPANSVWANTSTATEAGFGTQFAVRSFGTLGSAAGTATTIMGLYYNGAASGTAFGSTASQTPATSTVNIWVQDSFVAIATTGSSGTAIAAGTVIGIGATATTPVLMPATGATITFNSTQANYISIAASWSASAAGNTYTVYGHHLLQLN